MPREFARHVRIAESIKRVLAEPVMRAGRDGGFGMLTVTRVIVASDLSTARVLVSAFAVPEGRSPLDRLKDLRPVMRQLIARELQLKKIPTLYVELDETMATAARIGDLLSDSSRE